MLSGQLPFRGKSSIQILQKHIREPAPGLAGVAPGIPGPLAAIVDRLLAKSPEERFPTADALVAALAKALPAQAAPTAPTLPAASVRRPSESAVGQGSQPVTARTVPRSPDVSHAETADMDETTDQTGESSPPTLAPAPAERPPAPQPPGRPPAYLLIGLAVCLVLILLVVVGRSRRSRKQPPALSTTSTTSTTSTPVTTPPPAPPGPPEYRAEIKFRDGRKAQGALVSIDSEGFVTLDLGDGKAPVRHKLSEIEEIVPLKSADRPRAP
jgi:serine/threonine-protein kinase PpkA